MNKFDYGVFSKYISDDNITDINYNGQTIWVDHIYEGRYQVIEDYTQADMENFCYRFANYANKQFNNSHPILESETDDLRISILHKSLVSIGYSISIRKTPARLRLNSQYLIESNYADEELLNILKELVIKRNNIIISGLPGVGKTEFLKYLTKFINANERVITIEDNLEIRYPIIHQDKDGVMLKINRQVSYREAIKASLRQRVDWILLSEVRGDEVVELLQAVSTGSSLISTIHADGAESIPNRLLHMFPGNEIVNDKLLYRIHETIDYGVHIRSEISNQGVKRYIAEVVRFNVAKNKVVSEVIYRREGGYNH